MQVFKFGGASVKDGAGVQNVVKVLKEVGHEQTLIVVSAMGKTTNGLEQVVADYRDENKSHNESLQQIIHFHESILDDLFPNKNHKVYATVSALFDELKGFLNWNKSPNYNFVYDQIVSFGELISTTIVAAYLEFVGVDCQWLDVRTCVKTDANYRDAGINWDQTKALINEKVNGTKLNVTQGFLGSDANNFTTTLGREGSDYSAAIFAYCLNATAVTIWKDVPGVLNADPRYFDKAKLLHNISYEEAIELAFYGASVIHPKTLQPLQRKEIPLYVKSFLNPTAEGTCVKKGTLIDPLVPCFIVKKNQTLISLSSLDFSFIVENNISEIFQLLHHYKLKVDVIQNSAISFSVCVEDKFGNLNELIQQLKAKFKVSCTENVSLYTIRHFTDEAINSLSNGKQVLLKQENQNTVQLVTE